MSWSEEPEKHTSGAEAHLDLLAFAARPKSHPFKKTSRGYFFEPIRRMRAVNALPSNSLKVLYWGESTTLFTTNGFSLSVMFSMTPRSPKYDPRSRGADNLIVGVD